MNMHIAAQAAAGERLEIVSTDARLAEIAPAWTDLWRATDGLIFQSHDWIAAWWSTVARRNERQLRIGLVWQGDRLLAVFPLAIQRRKGLRFLEWAANDCSDYADILLDSTCPPALITTLWQQLVSAGGFDLYFLNRLRPDGTFRALLDAPGGPRLAPSHRQEVAYRVAGDWPSGAQWVESLNKKARQNYRRGRKALDEAGAGTLRLLPLDEPMAPVLARLAELKRKWLQRKERESALYEEGSSALLALVDVLAKAGVLRVFVIECDGAIIAISVNFIQRGTLMAFLTTYDPDFERGSPGMVLMMDYIQWSIDEGLTLVDFLCGEEPFKQKFATGGLTLTSTMGARTPLGMLAMFAEKARLTLRTFQARRAAKVTTPAE